MPNSVLAQISDVGVLTLSDPSRWKEILRAHKGERVQLTLEKQRQARSDPQNRHYFGVIVPVVREILSKGRDLPLSKDQTHWLLKSAFLGCEETPLGLVPKSTARLSVSAFAEYTEKIEAHFRAEYGAVFEEPYDAA